jgi:hypothetical protein
MGAKLVDYYERANTLGGLKAKMRLAMLTLMPGNKAEEAEDSPDILKKFEEAFKELENEFK